nr:neuropeptide-like protein 31 [Procambarus clarkii]
MKYELVAVGLAVLVASAMAAPSILGYGRGYGDYNGGYGVYGSGIGVYDSGIGVYDNDIVVYGRGYGGYGNGHAGYDHGYGRGYSSGTAIVDFNLRPVPRYGAYGTGVGLGYGVGSTGGYGRYGVHGK